MKRYNKFIFILFVTAILSGIATSLEAQDKPKKKKTALIEVKGLVTDNTGKPLSGVTVLSGEGSIINYYCCPIKLDNNKNSVLDC